MCVFDFGVLIVLCLALLDLSCDAIDNSNRVREWCMQVAPSSIRFEPLFQTITYIQFLAVRICVCGLNQIELNGNFAYAIRFSVHDFGINFARNCVCKSRYVVRIWYDVANRAA